MFDLFGPYHRFCDRTSRRDFLRIGALGLGGITLADVLRLRAQAKPARRPKSVIMVCLCGGPSHIDTYDLKPKTPAEIRGEFKPIASNVPGLDLCELLPLQAKIADKLAVIRGVQFHDIMTHSPAELFTGYTIAERRPSFGSVYSRIKGSSVGALPSYVSLDRRFTNPFEHPRYLGPAHQPLFYGDGVEGLELPRDISRGRLENRRELLGALDSVRRNLDAGAERLDPFTARALDMIASPQTRQAFDISQEQTKVRERYGQPGARYGYVREGDQVWPTEKFLLARRLVEAGVPVVTLCVGYGMSGWDHHGKVGGFSLDIFSALRSNVPLLDRSVHALVTDLHDRGLDKDVMVLVWGEFGRTPKITPTAGRDHWIDAGFALVAGGGMRLGQAVGQTDARGERPRGKGFHAQNVVATVYRHLGIDPTLHFDDHEGRPLPLLDHPEPIAELL